MKRDPSLWRSVQGHPLTGEEDAEIATLRLFASRRKHSASTAQIRKAIRRVLFERDAAHIFLNTFDAE